MYMAVRLYGLTAVYRRRWPYVRVCVRVYECGVSCVVCIAIHIMFTETCTFSPSHLVYNSNVEVIALHKAYHGAHGASMNLYVCIWHAGVAVFFLLFILKRVCMRVLCRIVMRY